MIYVRRALSRVILLLLANCLCLCTAWAALDSTASTDDHSVNVPTSWWTYSNVSAARVTTFLNKNSARLTDLEIYAVTNGVPTFTVRMVRNSGAYAVPGWWWYYGLTANDVANFLNTNTARLIELEPYDAGGGTIRFAAIMVSDTGITARAWHWFYGVSAADIVAFINNSGDRLIDLDSYVEGNVKKYTIVSVANTGSDDKAWQFWFNQSTAGISSKVSAFNGRVVKLDRQADGTYNFIQVANTGADGTAWWYHYGFTSLTSLNNYALQVASRPVDITTYVSAGARRYDATFIDNANAGTRRMRDVFAQNFLDANGEPTRGIFEAYLRRIDSGAAAVKVDLNGGRRAEVASSLKSLHLLHAMRQMQAGVDSLASSFIYYEYDPVSGKDACPDPALETAANIRTNYDFETGLRQMMAISDNRTTRGTVLRYGGTFTPLNATASAAGLTGTTVRHNIGCAYFNLTTQKYDPTHRRNDTTAADLAHIYDGVWNATLLNETNNARSDYLSIANPGSGASAALQAIINQEAAALGKSGSAASFGALIKTWGKGGSYGTCLPNAAGGCGQKVIVRSGTGLIRLPIKVNNVTQYRTFAFGRLISDVPVPCWEDFSTPAIECAADTNYTNAYNTASNELYRDEIHSALLTW